MSVTATLTTTSRDETLDGEFDNSQMVRPRCYWLDRCRHWSDHLLIGPTTSATIRQGHATWPVRSAAAPSGLPADTGPYRAAQEFRR